MKKILIVIHDMRIGGAQKSLLSFLQSFAAEGHCNEYNVHVLPLNPQGEFLAQIPAGVTVNMPGNTLRWLGQHMSRELLQQHFSLRGLLGEALWVLRKALHLFPKGLNLPQRVWHNWRRVIPGCEEKYDVAIAYMDGTPCYYVMDKVRADKKVLWLHNDYEKVGYEAAFDAPYYAECDALVTISEECRASVCAHHPDQTAKVAVLENITASRMVMEKSRDGVCREYENCSGVKLLTVGRLHDQKGIDIAIGAACELRKMGVDFRWLVAGEGSERKKLEALIAEASLQESFVLMGAKNNPYPYMRECDILVQPSRYEGKSIVLDEAKILSKPIVATAYSTVHDAIVHGETGWIVDMNSEAVARGIQKVYQDHSLREKLINNLNAKQKGNEAELKRYMDLML